MKSLGVLIYTFPASLLVFCWLTMGASATYDGDTITTYGFPLNWYTPSTVSSGGQDVAVVRLIIDLAVFVLLGQLPGWGPKNGSLSRLLQAG